MRNKPSINLICGFIGFGKTTFAKKLEMELPAVRFTHEDNFREKYKKVDSYIRQEAVKFIETGQNVILDYGFWSKPQREEYYKWAKTITPNVIFYVTVCSLDVARKRVIERTKNNPSELFIDENIFDELLKQYEPISENEGYPIKFYNTN